MRLTFHACARGQRNPQTYKVVSEGEEVLRRFLRPSDYVQHGIKPSRGHYEIVHAKKLESNDEPQRSPEYYLSVRGLDELVFGYPDLVGVRLLRFLRLRKGIASRIPGATLDWFYSHLLTRGEVVQPPPSAFLDPRSECFICYEVYEGVRCVLCDTAEHSSLSD